MAVDFELKSRPGANGKIELYFEQFEVPDPPPPVWATHAREPIKDEDSLETLLTLTCEVCGEKYPSYSHGFLAGEEDVEQGIFICGRCEHSVSRISNRYSFLDVDYNTGRTIVMWRDYLVLRAAHLAIKFLEGEIVHKQAEERDRANGREPRRGAADRSFRSQAVHPRYHQRLKAAARRKDFGA